MALFATVATVVTLEVACRIALPGWIGNPGWAGDPGTELRLVSAPDKFSAVHRYNSLGFRGPEISITPSKGIRIVCIGDSWTEGIGADEDETWPAVLQKKLGGSDHEVVNLGDSGSAPHRYLQILAEVGIPLHPTHAIVCIIPSDLVDGPQVPPDLVPRNEMQFSRDRSSNIERAIAKALPGFTRLLDWSRSQRRQGSFWEPWNPERFEFMVVQVANREGVTRTVARQLVTERMASIAPSCVQAAKRGEFNGARIVLEVVRPFASFTGRVEDMEVPAEALRESTSTWINWYAENCRRHQVVPILVFFPEAGLVSDAPVGPLEDEHFVGCPSTATDNSVSQMLAALCQKHDVRFIDCTSVLRAYTGEERLFLRYDAHPTACAYRIAGTYIADVLKQDVLKAPAFH